MTQTRAQVVLKKPNAPFCNPGKLAQMNVGIKKTLAQMEALRKKSGHVTHQQRAHVARARHRQTLPVEHMWELSTEPSL